MEKGDTLEYISEENGVPVWKIIYDNQLDLPDRLVPGQALLLLKEGEKGYEGEGLRIGGYAYPFIEPEILTQAFPALQELLVFSYGLHLKEIWSRLFRMICGLWKSPGKEVQSRFWY